MCIGFLCYCASTLVFGLQGRHRCKAVQVQPIKPMLKAPGLWSQRSKLESRKLLSTFDFNPNLRRYTVAAMVVFPATSAAGWKLIWCGRSATCSQPPSAHFKPSFNELNTTLRCYEQFLLSPMIWDEIRSQSYAMLDALKDAAEEANVSIQVCYRYLVNSRKRRSTVLKWWVLVRHPRPGVSCISRFSHSSAIH